MTFKTACTDHDIKILLWATMGEEPSLVGSGEGTLMGVAANKTAMFTALEWCKQPPTSANPCESKTLIPAGAAAVVFEQPLPPEAHAVYSTTHAMCKGLSLTIEGCAYARCISDEVVHDNNRRCKAAIRLQNAFVQKHKLRFDSRMSHAICAPTMIEADLPFGGSFLETPAVAGWPQCNRVMYDCGTYFLRALTYACLVSGCQHKLLANGTRVSNEVLEVLAAATLTAFAGNYPATSETTDDRSNGEIKFGLNRDCDDMAITVVSAFNHLCRVGKINYAQLPEAVANNDPATVKLATILHSYILDTYKCAAAVICQAVAHVAVPGVKGSKDSPLCGHVFAVLSRATPAADGSCSQLMKHCLMIESTRMSAPASDAMSTYTHSQQPVFVGRPVYNPAEAGIRGMKPFNPAQYPRCVSAYTKDASYLLVDQASRTIGCPIADLQRGAAIAMALPQADDSRYAASLDAICHKFDYCTMSKAAVDNGWQAHFSVPVNTLPMSHDKLDKWTLTGNAAELRCMEVQPTPSAMMLSNFNAYAFVDLHSDNTITNCML